MIGSFWVCNDSLSFKVFDDVSVMSIIHVSDLQKHFDVNEVVRDVKASFLQGYFN